MNLGELIPISLFVCIAYSIKVCMDARVRRRMVEAGGSAELVNGHMFVFDRKKEPGDASRVELPHPELFAAVSAGQSLLLDDGRIRLEVLASDAGTIRTRVINGGVLSDRKGVNVPDAVLPIPALTAKDRADLDFALCGDRRLAHAGAAARHGPVAPLSQSP